jgi:hypothetical protein
LTARRPRPGHSKPPPIRRELRIQAESTVEWVLEGDTVRVIPIPEDPIAALRGSGKRGEAGRLIADRRRDRQRGG